MPLMPEFKKVSFSSLVPLMKDMNRNCNFHNLLKLKPMDLKETKNQVIKY